MSFTTTVATKGTAPTSLHAVAFFARGIRLAAIETDGLRVQSERGNVHLQKVKATDKADEIGVVDAIVFCVKLWDVESAGEQIRPPVGSETCLIPMLKGIDASERLIPFLAQTVCWAALLC